MTDYIKREDAIRIARIQGKKAQFDGMAQDVAPVRHAKWMRTENSNVHGWVCSKCDVIGDPRDNYCPNCGAKMDGEE